MDVAFVSCLSLPEPDLDAAPLGRALSDAGIDAGVVAWDDPEANVSSARLTVLRSCWNYPRHRDAFLAWIARAAAVSELWNPLPVVRWNTHKGYLLELERQGLPVVPTVLLEKGTDLFSAAENKSVPLWSDFVVKPAVSAASFRTRRFRGGEREAGEAHLSSLLADGDTLVQQYLPSVEDHGERALIWIDGALTHGIRKSPRFDGQTESVSHDAVPIAPDEALLARRVLATIDHPLLYARVDIARNVNGDPVIMELELVEPSLFFTQGPSALARFVVAIRRELHRARPRKGTVV